MCTLFYCNNNNIRLLKIDKLQLNTEMLKVKCINVCLNICVFIPTSK